MIIIKKFFKKLFKVLKRIIFIIIILIIIFIGIIVGMAFGMYDGDVKKCATDVFSNMLGGVETKNILILGVSEDIDTELTDTIMVASYNPDTEKAFLISIPRDTFVGTSKSSARAKDKINAQYASGVENTIEAVENLTGLDIDGYVVVKTSILVEMVDLIGGVEFDVPIDMDYDDPTQDLHIHLSSGVQTLDGDQAEQLLRFRHNNDGTSYPASYGDNDYGRMRTQREFMKAVAEQTLKPRNILKINKIINAVSDNLITDMTTRELLAYVPKLVVFDTDNLVSEQLPGESAYLNGISFFVSDEDETESLIDELVSELNSDD